jgi:CBS domain-containing protein
MAQIVRDVMSTETVTVSPETSLQDAARVMRDEGIGDVLVAEQSGSLRGIVTDRDIVVRGIAEGEDPNACTVADISSGDVVSVAPESPLDEVVSLMRDRAVRRLPVVDGGRAVGMVSIGDLAIERDPDSALSEISAAAPNG